MKIISMDPYELFFTLEHKGHTFKVQGSFTGDGRLIFDPDNGWNDEGHALTKWDETYQTLLRKPKPIHADRTWNGQTDYSDLPD